jgi:putative copper resistance protein D
MTEHMVEHLVLTMVVAPLLVLGAQRTLRFWPRRLARLAVRSANWLVGLTAFTAAQLAIHFTGFFDYADAHEWAHVVEHAIFLVTGVMLWAPVIIHLQPLLLVAAMPVSGVIGAVLVADDHVRYRHYNSLADQHQAGAIMWAVGSLVMVVAAVAAAWLWLRREERRALAREAYGR